jgi:hypothetical protein
MCIQIRNRCTIDQNLSFGYLIKTGDQIHKAGLAGAGTTDDTDGLSRKCSKADILQAGFGRFIVSEGNIAKLHSTAKFLNLFLKKKINPMIGAAGISAFPMSGRIVHKMGLKEDPQNFLLMHSMGVNVSGQIASVIAGGLILGFFL